MISMSVCLFVYLYARISQSHTSKFHHVARSCFDGNAILCTSGFVNDVMFSIHIIEQMGSIRRRVCFVEFAKWRDRERSLPSPTASY